MQRFRKSSASEQEEPPAKVFHGFDTFGCLLKSAVPVRTAATELVRHLRDKALADFLSPAEVILFLLQEPQHLRSIIPLHSVRFWTELDRFWHWPLAQGGNAAAEAIKSLGLADAAGRPCSIHDENRWSALCDESERVRGWPSRIVTRQEAAAAIDAMCAGFASRSLTPPREPLSLVGLASGDQTLADAS